MYLEQLEEQIEKIYGELNPKEESMVLVSEDKEEELDEEIEIEWDPISIDDLGTGLNMSVREISAIGFIFREFEDIVSKELQEESKEEVSAA